MLVPVRVQGIDYRSIGLDGNCQELGVLLQVQQQQELNEAALSGAIGSEYPGERCKPDPELPPRLEIGQSEPRDTE